MALGYAKFVMFTVRYLIANLRVHVELLLNNKNKYTWGSL